MTLSVVAWIFAGALLLLAAYFFNTAAQAKKKEAVLAKELKELQDEFEKVSKRLAKRDKEHDKRNEETAELRRNLEKLKKREKAQRSNQQVAPDRVSELEHSLARAEARYQEKEEQLLQTEGGLALARAELELLKKPKEAPAKPVTPVEDPRIKEIAELKTRLEELSPRTQAMEKELKDAKAQAKRYKNKNEVLDKTYVVLRGEHKIQREKLRMQRQELERLRAMSVTLGAAVPTTEPIDSVDDSIEDHDDDYAEEVEAEENL
jgi:chromosome segregation ATPase